MPPSAQVVVVGSLMQDLVFACDHFPASGQTILGRLHVGQGGKGSNQAIASGRAGARTLFIGAAGNDAFMRRVKAFYRAERIACRLAVKPALNTGTAVILLNRERQNQIVIEPGANAAIEPKDIVRSQLLAAKVVVTQLESDLGTTKHVLRLARRLKITTVLNPAPMRAEAFPDLLAHVDVLIPNESEFVALVASLPKLRRAGFDEAALHALAWADLHDLCRQLGVPTVIITLGSKGCFVSQADEYFAIPAHAGLAVVDTTGAGDAFCGGFAAGLVRFSGDVAAAAKFGTAVAGLSITKAGAAAAMPTLKEIEHFLGPNDGSGSDAPVCPAQPRAARVRASRASPRRERAGARAAR